ncbi:glycosyltransferase [uncultured Kocuria sp.]|uniref:glycosyltransferase n=1 Tax=uncultured Kocuria sp. TaxID=259305 RepID=UPI002603B2BD|nr:glycosyltransferase [uncultured Kocuria sp.]
MSNDPVDPAVTRHALDLEWLDRSIAGLRQAAPEMSAHRVLSQGQQIVVVALVLLVVGAAILDLILALQILVAVATLWYAATLVYRLVLVRRGLRGKELIRISDADALAVRASELPIYSVLIPAYREPDVIAKIIDSVSALDYPADKLDVRLLLEADDAETIAAARAGVAATISPSISIVLVPPADPRTKPKACNFGLQSATGDLVTIFDAEDRPEPLQLRRAVVALDRLGDGYACVQARLGYFNATQNLITRWFTIEYGTWFRFMLPGLVSLGAPIPLGGTSNHFRTGLLRALEAWDPYNVTEDADLGIRLARLGYSVGVLDSITEEEANSDFVNWIKQRSRWYKGYFQTWLVHMRRPVAVHRELGWRGALGLHLFVLGTPLTALMNPVFWALAIAWYLKEPEGVALLFPPAVYYFALACFMIGNAAVIYVNLLTTRVINKPTLLGAALLVPGYWVMMSVAAVKAAYQLVFNPSYWEKTSHGLDLAPSSGLVVVKA